MTHHKDSRSMIQQYGRRLLEQGLTTGSGGNLSLVLRDHNLMVISPSGIDYDAIEIADVSLVDFSGRLIDGQPPSSEWQLHLEVYRRRPEVQAVVHSHSRFATTLAVLHRPMPACHYLIGYAGTDTVKVAPYATFGTWELAEITVAAMAADNCVLMANHGLLAVGGSLEKAYTTALHCEEVAEIYCRAATLGDPVILNREQMQSAMERFRSYGKNREEQ